MKPNRTPATDRQPTYPTLSDHGDARRRFLKFCALSSAAAALGLPLVGCPGDGGSSGGGGGGGGGVGLGSGTDWVPWQEDHEALAGKVAMPVGAPIAVVINDDPIAVVFKDGVQADIVVAATVTPQRGVNVKSDFCTRTDEHVALVVKTAKAHPSSVFSDVAVLEAFESALRDGINGALSGGYVDDVSVAKIAEPVEAERKPAAPTESDERGKAQEKAKKAAPSKAAPATVQGTPKTKQLWMACRTPGCTDCGGAK